jgi:predicted RNase H-like nuclease
MSGRHQTGFAHDLQAFNSVHLHIQPDPTSGRDGWHHRVMLRCAGVDGCPRGWVVVQRDERRLDARVVTDLEETLHLADRVGVDMPIGLPSTPGRAADRAARTLLGPRRSSVFPAPARPLLPCRTHAEANSLSRSLFGVGLSVQTFHLFPKIREVDLLARSLPHHERDTRLAEVHPECSFLLAGSAPLPSKHTADGLALRRAVVERDVGEVPAVPRGARLDDVLDACAALWSVERFAVGAHRTIPDASIERDEHGTLMRIVV